jgi:hypothetical protein
MPAALLDTNAAARGVLAKHARCSHSASEGRLRREATNPTGCSPPCDSSSDFGGPWRPDFGR